MKEFFKDHPFLASAVTLLSVWSVTGTVRYVFGKSGTPKTNGPSGARAQTMSAAANTRAEAANGGRRVASPYTAPSHNPNPPTYRPWQHAETSQSGGQSAAHQGDDS